MHFTITQYYFDILYLYSLETKFKDVSIIIIFSSFITNSDFYLLLTLEVFPLLKCFVILYF